MMGVVLFHAVAAVGIEPLEVLPAVVGEKVGRQGQRSLLAVQQAFHQHILSLIATW